MKENKYSYYEGYNQILDEYKPLENDEIKNLILKARNGDRKARDIIIYNFIPLMMKIGKKFLDRNVSLDTVISICTVKMFDLIKKYDLNSSATFFTYAFTSFQNELIQKIPSENQLIRIPCGSQKTFKKLVSKIKAEGEIDLEAFQKEHKISKKILSGFYSVSSVLYESQDTKENEIKILGTIADQSNQYHDINIKLTLYKILNEETVLTEVERDYIYEMYLSGNYKRIFEVAKIFGVTQQNASYVINNAIKKLQRIYNNV